MSELTGRNHQFKCAQTVIGQRSAGNGPNGLPYDYYYYEYVFTPKISLLKLSTAKTIKNTSTTEKCSIVSSVSEWMCACAHV